MAFRLPKAYADAMVAHARAEAPNECCGVLAGKDGKIVKLYRCTNVEQSPYRYSVDPRELIKIDQEIRENDWEWLGIYHSHTHTEAYPSATDIRLAYWPDTLYFIISLKDPDRPVVRAFYIRDGRVEEVPVEVVPDEAAGR